MGRIIPEAWTDKEGKRGILRQDRQSFERFVERNLTAVTVRSQIRPAQGSITSAPTTQGGKLLQRERGPQKDP